MKQLFTILTFSLVIWFGGHTISAQITEAKFPQKNHASKLEALKKRSDAAPEDTALKIKLAESYLEQFGLTGDSQNIFRAIDAYSIVLKKEPENLNALSAMARISFESGATDNAVDYFEKYLKIKPDDYLIRNDYGLALIQLGDKEKAVQAFQHIVEQKPKFFGGQLGLALALKNFGQLDKAKEIAMISLDLAENEQQKTVVKRFISGLEISAMPELQEVENYFKFHQIIGPKLKGFNWTDNENLQVIVADFPIDSMPEVAKNSFIGKAKGKFSDLGKTVNISIFDVALPNKALSFTIGGKSENSS